MTITRTKDEMVESFPRLLLPLVELDVGFSGGAPEEAPTLPLRRKRSSPLLSDPAIVYYYVAAILSS